MSKRLLSVQQILNLHEPPWLVDRILPSNSLAMLWGTSNVGKSFVALDLACSVAADVPWLGQKVKAGPVVYIAGEGALGLKRRIRAWLTYHEFDTAILNDLRFVASPIQLQEEEAAARIIGLTRALDPSLVIIDTLAASSLGIDEDKTMGIGPVLGTLQAVRKQLDTAILVVHHTGWAGEHERGASGLRAAMDVSIEVKGDDAKVKRRTPRRRLICHKQRDAEKFDTIHLRLEEVVWETRYRPAKSLVVQHVG